MNEVTNAEKIGFGGIPGQRQSEFEQEYQNNPTIITKEYLCPDKCDKLHLYICTIYPDIPTPMMTFTLRILQDFVTKLHVLPIWVRAGKFSHRLLRKEKDTLQCKIRQMYVDRVPDGEWFLVMDSDEVLFGSIWSIYETLTMANTVESHKQPEFMSIWEMRSDVKFKARPRLIKKKEGISYISDVMKHDYIGITDKYASSGIEIEGELVTTDITRNYIEVQDPIWENSWTLDFLVFAHYKEGIGLELISDGILEFEDLPKNYKRLSDLEIRINEEVTT